VSAVIASFLAGGLLEKYKIKALTCTPVIEIEKDKVVIFKPPAKKEAITADTVILAVGREPVLDNKIVEAARKIAKRVYIIGDAKEPRKIIDAIHEGFFTALYI